MFDETEDTRVAPLSACGFGLSFFCVVVSSFAFAVSMRCGVVNSGRSFLLNAGGEDDQSDF
jgi:hypothetical protein